MKLSLKCYTIQTRCVDSRREWFWLANVQKKISVSTPWKDICTYRRERREM